MLYLHELLEEVLAESEARAQLLASALRPETIGPTLAPALGEYLAALPAHDLAEVLMAGMAREELPVHPGGLVEAMAAPQDFVIRPLPNLLFTRDSAVWLDHGVAVTQLAMPARRRESTITGAIYTHHPRFVGTELLYGGSIADQAWLEGGDVLVLAPGVLAIGVGQRTSPAGVEAFAQRLFATDEAQTVLAVPIAQDRATMHLDTVCTMVDRDAVVMYPPLADTLEAYVVEPGRVTGPEPFLAAAARAMGIGELRVIDTGPRPRDRRARAVGRRQQHARDRARARDRLRAQHRDERAPDRRGDRGHHDRRLGARHRPRRPALHVLPGAAGPGLAASSRVCSASLTRRSPPGCRRRGAAWMIISRISSGVTPLRIARADVHRQLVLRAQRGEQRERQARARAAVEPVAPPDLAPRDVGQVRLERRRVLRRAPQGPVHVLVAEHLSPHSLAVVCHQPSRSWSSSARSTKTPADPR